MTTSPSQRRWPDEVRKQWSELKKSLVPQVIEFLKSSGFTHIDQINEPTEFKAIFKENLAYILFRVRVPNAVNQTFSIRLETIHNLQRLSTVADVFILLYNNHGFRLVPLLEVPNYPEILIFSKVKPIHWILLYSSNELEESLGKICDVLGGANQRTKAVDEMIRFTRANLESFRAYRQERKTEKIGVVADLSGIRTESKTTF